MAVARNVVVLSGATVTEKPEAAKSVAVPVAAGVPVQSLVVYSDTVDPASAEPLTTGVVLWDGEGGVTLVSSTSGGAVESLV